MDKKIVTIGGDTYKLLFDDFDEEVDIDSLLKIDYSNLIGEIVTFPVILNRFGLLLAEAESQVAETKLNLDVFEAKTKERLRVELAEQNNGKSPTVEALNNAVTSNKAYRAMKRKLIEVTKTRDYINSVFWAVKDKSDKISSLIKQSDITLESEVMTDRLNGVLINKTNKQLIK